MNIKNLFTHLLSFVFLAFALLFLLLCSCNLILSSRLVGTAIAIFILNLLEVPAGINFVNPSLIHVDDKYEIISEAAKSLHGRHFNDEAEEVIDDGVQEREHQSLVVQVGDAFESVVDVQLGHHVDEAEGVDAANQGVDDEGVIALVLVVHERVNGIANDQWNCSFLHITHRYFVIFFGLVFFARI